MAMRFTVLIPTYRRSASLVRCLNALKGQERLPDEVVVTVRDTDEETQTTLATFDAAPLRIRSVIVTEPGVVSAMNRGLESIADADIIALTDDDTEPWSDWLLRMEKFFSEDPHIGGVGGRDWQPYERSDKEVVGIVQWFGRIIGNQHLGAGPARPVDILKGANCAFRASLLKSVGFDSRVTGSGAQVNWEIGLCLKIRRGGWKLIYDPAICVEHHVEKRHDDNQIHRGLWNAQAYRDMVHNETLYLWEHLSPLRRMAFILWSVTVGTQGNPGLAQIARLMARRDPHTWQKFTGTLQGRYAGVQTSRRTQDIARRQTTLEISKVN
jgi:GT2 family glycosyltransferase